MWNQSTGLFTFPVSGFYAIYSSVYTVFSSGNLTVTINGTFSNVSSVVTGQGTNNIFGNAVPSAPTTYLAPTPQQFGTLTMTTASFGDNPVFGSLIGYVPANATLKVTATCSVSTKWNNYNTTNVKIKLLEYF
jgi:hypothetical protein